MGIAADLAIILVAALIEFTWFMLPAASPRTGRALGVLDNPAELALFTTMAAVSDQT
jgi:hypothetical protein